MLVWQNASTRQMKWHMPWLQYKSWEFFHPDTTPGAHAIAR
jgi:hypothetical protein